MEKALTNALVIHGSINGLNTIFYLHMDNADAILEKGIGISVRGVGVVISLNPLVIKCIEVIHY
uniref:Uncharacterized protein n=1 Tax=Staphylothermus marinus TaxID=2280 RepID=A0A7J3KEM8_STAMA